jgi:hypothetical protein
MGAQLNVLLPLLAAVAGLGVRPPELTGGDPAGYSAKLAGFALALAGQAEGEPCPAAQATSVVGAPLSTADLAADGVRAPPAGGAAWDEHLRVEGCGRTIVVKLIIARLPQDWGAVPLPPGTGVVGVRLSKDVAPMAAAAAEHQRPDLACTEDERRRTLRLANAELLTSYAKGRPWAERWTFSICGQARPVDIDFTPAADGGTDYRLKVR